MTCPTFKMPVWQRVAGVAHPTAQMLPHHHPLPVGVGWCGKAWSPPQGSANSGVAAHPLLNPDFGRE